MGLCIKPMKRYTDMIIFYCCDFLRKIIISKVITMSKLYQFALRELFSQIRKYLKIVRIQSWFTSSDCPISFYIGKSVHRKTVSIFIGIDSFFN